jgi:catechol 2,3-dioxygenase-like lactoylglutathione lyase family enzyme
LAVPYAIKHLYHSTHWVPDLSEATRFFRNAFGRESKVLSEYLGGGGREIVPGFPRDYATFTPIAEVQVECIDPTLLLIDGVQPHERVTEPHLGELAWFVDGIEDLWDELRRRDIRGMDQRNVMPEGGAVPRDVSSTPIIFTAPDDTGLGYEFCVYMPRRDPRGDPPVSAVSADDPLGIERCSHHTILTKQLARALRLVVDVLGGRTVHEGRNEVLATQSTYVALADGILEFAEPLKDGSPAMDDWVASAPRDTYHSLTWKVKDLAQVADHLKAAGIRLRAHTDLMIVTNPEDSLGMPWGFTTAATPGHLSGAES